MKSDENISTGLLPTVVVVSFGASMDSSGAPWKEMADLRINFAAMSVAPTKKKKIIRKNKYRYGVARNVPIVKDVSIKSSTESKRLEYAKFLQQLEVKADSVVQAVAMNVLNNPDIKDDAAVKIVHDLLTLYKDSK